ncbi:MAG: GNAT family N-acetyltransferase [Flavobacteriales bacterium]
MAGSSPAVRIRAGILADIPVIQTIALRAWPVAYGDILSPEQLAYMLETRYSEAVLRSQMEQGEVFLLAFEGDQALGFAGIGLNYRQQHITRLHKLYIEPSRLRTGLGRLLVEAVINSARRAGDTAVNLNVNKYNPARGFYAHLGFACVGEEVLDIGKGYVMDDLILERRLDEQQEVQN